MFLRRIYWRRLSGVTVSSYEHSVDFERNFGGLIMTSVYRPTNSNIHRLCTSDHWFSGNMMQMLHC